MSDLGVSKAEALITPQSAYTNGFDWQAAGILYLSTTGITTAMCLGSISPLSINQSLRVAFGRMLAKRNVDSETELMPVMMYEWSGSFSGPEICPLPIACLIAQYAVMPDDERKSCSSEEALAKARFWGAGGGSYCGPVDVEPAAPWGIG